MQNQQQMGQQMSSAQQMQGPAMNDRDRANDLLATEKYLTQSYNTAVHEAGSEQLYQLQLQHLQDSHQAARELFSLMQQRGWYQVEPAEQQKISQKTTQFAQYSSQFPY
jgi:spore coat protein CotF